MEEMWLNRIISTGDLKRRKDRQRAKSQEPSAKSQAPRAKRHCSTPRPRAPRLSIAYLSVSGVIPADISNRDFVLVAANDQSQLLVWELE